MSLPTDAGEIALAIARAGYRRDGDRWVDPARIDPAGDLDAPRIDPSIPTQRFGRNRLPPVVASLASQVERGGFRVVALAVPGGIHEDRVRLNERYNLPYTPDTAAVYVEAEGAVLA